MVHPKEFYRSFDEFLKKIRITKNSKNFVYSLLRELQKNTFAEELHIGALMLYEELGDDFVLKRQHGTKSGLAPKKLPAGSKPIEELLRHGTFIYDEQDFTIVPSMSQQEHYAVPAAFVIRSPELRWIAVFELTDGWIREEVIFSLNAIRTSLNYRLFAEAIETEMEQAAQIQHSLLPTRNPKIPGYQVAGKSQATEVVGGDLFDYFEFSDDIFGIAIGDASGHGIPAALLVRDTVIGLRMGIERHLKMVHSLKNLNRVLYRSTYSSRFVSLFYGEIERDGHLIFVNAGHPAPFIVSGDDVIDLEATSLILGALPEIEMHRSFARINANSVLVMFSDGIIEREDEDEELFTIARLKQLVIEHQDKDAREIQDIIFKEVYDFGNRTKWEDDSTVVVVKRVD